MDLLTLLFHGSALSVLPFWGAMIFFPNAERTKRLVSSPWIIFPPVLCYLAVLLPQLPAAIPVFRNPSPDTLRAFTGEPWGATLYWTYAGAFDLFVGRWIFFDAPVRKVSRWFVTPALLSAIFFGPVGFTIYAIGVAVSSSKETNGDSLPRTSR